MNEFLDSIFPAGAFFMIGFLTAAGWVTFQFILKLIKNYFKPADEETSYKEGCNYILIKDTENTQYPEKYSEGVFAWYKDDQLNISEEYQIHNGGDPMVFKKYILKSDTISAKVSKR